MFLCMSSASAILEFKQFYEATGQTLDQLQLREQFNSWFIRNHPTLGDPSFWYDPIDIPVSNEPTRIPPPQQILPDSPQGSDIFRGPILNGPFQNPPTISYPGRPRPPAPRPSDPISVPISPGHPGAPIVPARPPFQPPYHPPNFVSNLDWLHSYWRKGKKPSKARFYYLRTKSNRSPAENAELNELLEEYTAGVPFERF